MEYKCVRYQNCQEIWEPKHVPILPKWWAHGGISWTNDSEFHWVHWWEHVGASLSQQVSRWLSYKLLLVSCIFKMSHYAMRLNNTEVHYLCEMHVHIQTDTHTHAHTWPGFFWVNMYETRFFAENILCAYFLICTINLYLCYWWTCADFFGKFVVQLERNYWPFYKLFFKLQLTHGIVTNFKAMSNATFITAMV